MLKYNTTVLDVLPEYVVYTVKCVLRRALRIIYPNLEYNVAWCVLLHLLQKPGKQNPFSHLIPTCMGISHGYGLRSSAQTPDP